MKSPVFTPPKCKFAPWWRSDALAATAAWLRNTKMRIALPLPTRLSRLRCLSSRAIHLSPTLFTAAAVPADIAALNQKVEAAAHGTPLLSAAPPQVARKARAALFKHEPRRVDLRVPGLREGSPSVGISIFMPRDGGEQVKAATPAVAGPASCGSSCPLALAYGSPHYTPRAALQITPLRLRPGELPALPRRRLHPRLGARAERSSAAAHGERAAA